MESAGAIVTSERYWQLVDELRRVDWRDNEHRIARVVLDECLRQRTTILKLTQKKDFEVFLGGRELKNFANAIDELRAMRVLL